MPNAAVNIINQQTNVSQRVLTGPDGSFSIAGLAPGTYRVEVESAGFKRTAVNAVELTAPGPQMITITLEAGPTTETVELTARASMIQTENATMSLSLPTRPVRSYPILDNNWMELNGLMTGVTPPLTEFPAAVDPAQQRFFSVNGQNPFVNAYYMDGMVNLEPFRGTAIRVPPLDTIREMSIRTASLPAERGFTATGWSNVQSHAGTNNWHGTGFWFGSWDNVNSRTWFNPSSNPAQLAYNQYGGTFGGPIRKDSWYLFASYEGTRDREHRPQFATVPTLDMRAGNFSGIPGLTLFNPNTGTPTGVGRAPFPNNIIPPGQINPFSASIASALPAPNLPGTFQNFSSVDYLRRDGQKFDGRLDKHFGESTNFFLRYGYSNWGVVEASPLGETFGGGDTTRLVAQQAVGSVTHNFSPAFLGELRLGYTRYQQRITPRAFSTTSFLGLPSSELPTIQFTGGTTLAPTPAIGGPLGTDNNYYIISDWMLTRSRHQFRFGVDLRFQRSTGFNTLDFGPRGTVAFGTGPTLVPGDATTSNAFANSFASFLLGASSATGSSNFQLQPGVEQRQFAGYAGDRVNLTVGGLRGFTLDLGVRYTVFSPVEARKNGSVALYDQNTNTFNFAGIGRFSRSIQNWDTNNVAPLVGIAISPTNRTVIRAGGSVNYFQIPYNVSGIQPAVAGTIFGTVGTFAVPQVPFGPNTFQPPAPVRPIVPGMSADNVPVVFTTARNTTPKVYTYNFQVQQELPASMVFQVAYVGALGRQLPFLNDLNIAPPGGVQPFAAEFGRTASTARVDFGLTNNYNSLQTSLSKRLSHHANFQAAYTYSKALDFSSNFGELLNPFNRRANYGASDFDRKHVFSLAWLFEVPVGKGSSRMNTGVIGQILGGWEINGVFRWATGVPFTVLADPLACNCPGVPAVTANVIGKPPVADVPGPDRRVFLPGFFSQPIGGFGDLGRNVLFGTGFKNTDLSVFKEFGIQDKYRLEFRGSAFNISNTPRFNNPVNLVNSPSLGQVFEPLNSVDGLEAGAGRVFVLGLRLVF